MIANNRFAVLWLSNPKQRRTTLTVHSGREKRVFV